MPTFSQLKSKPARIQRSEGGEKKTSACLFYAGLLLDLFFDPENLNRILRNVG
jgi:hypothetical protein